MGERRRGLLGRPQEDDVRLVPPPQMAQARPIRPVWQPARAHAAPVTWGPVV